ncbi:MAG: hypothetical protein HYX38_27060 [Rhodospirillales bacterium]|nr:hypothetical protein [Rhodospirillales bacterium]
MTSAVAIRTVATTRLDFDLLRRGCLYFAIANAVVAPFAPDPLAYGGGALVPFVLMTIIGQPTMPKGLAFFLLWQWGQAFARAVLSVLDGESMAASIDGVDVLYAYWYALASIITLAVAFRLVLGNLASPTFSEYHAHERWRPPDLATVYFVAIVASVALVFLSRSVPGADQPFQAAAQVKVIALFLLCTYVFTTGRGRGALLAAIVVEILVGFTGFLADFRAVFIYVAVAALAARVKWSGATTAAAFAWLAVLLILALFWTSVKFEYREYVTGSEESQQIKVPLEQRLAYLGERALNIGDTKWGETSYLLLTRFAYVDIFGQVIGVDRGTHEPIAARQWKDAFAHVFQPRFLFPDKPGLSDSEVFIRLARSDPMEQMRLGTSISVGYMAENYVDLGFPGMLAGIFGYGLLLALVVRYFMTRPLPWMLREAIVMGLAYNTAGTGMEVSLPKLLGATVMFFLVWSLMAKFALPVALRWLDRQAGVP